MAELLLASITLILLTGFLWISWRTKTQNELETIHQRVKHVVYQYDLYSTGELMVELKQNGIRAVWIPRYLEALYNQEIIKFESKFAFRVINRREKLY